MSMRNAIIPGSVLSLSLWLGGCAGGSLQPLPPPGAGPYRLGAGDNVRVTVFNEPALTGEFLIDPSGAIDFPLLGQIRADGETTQNVAALIATRLRAANYLRDPNVSVTLLHYRQVFVLGEVQHPGSYPFQPHLDLLGAVALAGGFTPRAVKSWAEVDRLQSGERIKARAQPDAEILPGDVITIPERNF